MDDQVPEVPLVLVSNAYLEQKNKQVRQKNILWQECELTQEQIQLIKAIDKKPIDVIQDAIDKNGQAYADLILYLLNHSTKQDTLRYLCLLTDDILSANEANAKYFHNRNDNASIYEPFAHLLDSEDEYLSLESSKILTLLACTCPSLDTDISRLCNWITQKLQGSTNDIIDIIIQELESLLRIDSYRIQFWNAKDAVKLLVHRLYLNKSSSNPQIQYQVIFCLWLLTFEKEVAENINEKYDIIPLLVDVSKNAMKEKVIRVSVATFRNLIEKAPSQNLAAMLVARLLPFSENLSGRKWTDDDILEDVEFIKERLQEDFQSLTTFEKYASEVETAKLEWSPPHKSESFWKENAYKLEEHQYQILRDLARILSTSTNPQVLAIAASDVGYYIKYATKAGKDMLQEIGAKQRIMELMTHQDQEVRYQALMAVQKYMHQAW